MSGRKRMESDRKRTIEAFNALIPSVEDLSEVEISGLLTDTGLSPDEILAKAHRRLQEFASRNYFSRGRDVPPMLSAALLQLKPVKPEERLDVERKHAKTIIQSLVDAVRNSASLAQSSESRLQPAFRNKTNLTSADTSELESIQRELDIDSDKNEGKSE